MHARHASPTGPGGHARHLPAPPPSQTAIGVSFPLARLPLPLGPRPGTAQYFFGFSIGPVIIAVSRALPLAGMI